MSTFVRQTLAGNPVQVPSFVTENAWQPIEGWKPASPNVLTDPSSLISTQNTWIREGNLEARWKLSQASIGNQVVSGSSNVTIYDGGAQNISPASLAGVFSHWDVAYQNPVLIAGIGTNFYLGSGRTSDSKLSWSALSYVSSTGSSLPPIGDPSTPWFGATVYSASRNTNLCVIVGAGSGSGAVPYCYWVGGSPGVSSANTFFSLLTGAPGGKDVVAFANRAVIWNTYNLGAAAPSIPQRVQWCVAGNPEDWTGIGSGSEDLVDIRGNGTRIFAEADQMILASDREIWRGRFIGDPYYFQFTPITRSLGMPFPRAALQTNDGIFWLDEDFMIWRMVGEAIQPVGGPMQAWLRDNMHAADSAFLTYNPTLQQLRLHFSLKSVVGTASGGYPSASITLDIASNGVWTQEVYPHFHHYGLSHKHPDIAVLNKSPIASIPMIHELLFTSKATVGYFDRSATSDLGGNVTEDCFLGTIGDESLTWIKTCEEVRLEVAARQPSTVTLSVSTDVGKTSYWSQALSITSSSYVSQVIAYPKTSGIYHNVRLQSTNGAWSIPRMYARFRRDGEAR